MSPPSAGELLRVWLALGLQSFGGGMATLALVRRASVEQHRWVTEAEFARFWSLVQLAPGINLLALIILIGRKTAGAKGIALALLGLLLPSVAITVLLTACYARVQHMALVREALSGIIPAIVGLGLVTAGQIARPLFLSARREGWGRTAFAVFLLLGSGLAAWRGHWPVVVILGGAGMLASLANLWQRGKVGSAP